MLRRCSERRSGAAALRGLSWGVLGYEVDLAKDAGGDGLDFIEVLHLEAVSVFGDEGFVVVGWKRGPGVEGGVVDADLDVVVAGFEERGDVEAVGRVPEGAGGFAVDGDESGFADGWVKVGVHAGPGSGDSWVRQAVGAEDGMLGWGVWCSGEGFASVDFEEDRAGFFGGEGEVAGVDGFSGVVEGGGVGYPVGEGGFGGGLVEGGEGDVPVGGEVGDVVGEVVGVGGFGGGFGVGEDEDAGLVGG